MGRCPASNPDGGKTYFNRCLCACLEARWKCWSDTGEQKAVGYCIFAVGMMTHLSSKMDRHPGTPSGGLAKDTNGRWLIGNWGKWLLWYWNHHWCNVIEMTMTYVSFCFYHFVWQKTKSANINIKINATLTTEIIKVIFDIFRICMKYIM